MEVLDINKQKEIEKKQAHRKAVSKYNKEKYKSLQVFLDKQLVDEFKETLSRLNLTQSDAIRYFLKSFNHNYNTYVYMQNFNEYKFKPIVQENKVVVKSREEIERERVLEKIKKLSSISDAEELYNALHDSYFLKMPELKRLAEELNLDLGNKKNRHYIMFRVYNYFLDRMDCSDIITEP